MSVKALKKQLLAAVCMVLVAVIALSSATFAWFSANNQVTAKGMNVTAKADSGIVIKYASDSTATFKTTADVAQTTATALYPASTVNLSDWFKAQSSQKNNAEASQEAANYTEISATEAPEYYKQYDFIVRSSAESVPVTGVKLAVNSFTVTSATSTSENLDKAVRLGVLCNGTFYIYAPMATQSVPITPGYSYDTTRCDTIGEITATANNGDVFTLSSNTIPASDTGITVSVFVWFEGEDANCKSSNVTASLDNISVQVVFQTVDVA